MRELREYFRPETPEQAIDIKKSFGPDAVYLGGGSDLLVHRPGHVRAVIDIRHCGMGAVATEQDWHVIGGSALLRDVERELNEVAGGMLCSAVRETAPWLIRNAATLSGNIANASPAADSVPALIALDARVDLRDGQETSVPVEDVLLGPHQTNLGNRLVTAIRIGREAGKRTGVFTKLARSKSDIAQVNAAVTLSHDGDSVRNVRIVLGAVAPTVIRIRRAERLLEGQIPSLPLLRAVADAVTEEVQPISDWRASAEYRRRMSGVLVRRALERLCGVSPGGETP